MEKINKESGMDNYSENCSNCGYVISEGVYDYSKKVIGKPLCRLCQIKGNHVKDFSVSELSVKLCDNLREKGISCTLEKKIDRYLADIFFEDIGIIIEIDGDIHFSTPDKIISDIRKTIYFIEQGFGLIRIPNHIIENDLYGLVERLETVHNTMKNELNECENFNPHQERNRLIELLKELGDEKYKRFQKIIYIQPDRDSIDPLSYPYCRRTKNLWTVEEEKLLEDLFIDGFSFNELSILLERHPKSVKKHLRIMNKYKS